MTTTPATETATSPATGGRRLRDTDAFALSGYLIGGLVMLIGFAGSFASFKAAAVRVGIDNPLFGGASGPDLSHLIPLSVDALALVASVIMVAPGSTEPVRRYALNVVYGAVAVSAVANGYEHIMHAVHDLGDVNGGGDPSLWVPAVLIGLIFPVSMAVTMHMLLMLVSARKAAAEAAEAADAADAADAARRAEQAEQRRNRRAAAAADTTPTPVTAQTGVPAQPRPAASAAPAAVPGPAAPQRRPGAPAGNAGGGEAAVLAAITGAEAAGTEFAALSGKPLAEAADVSGAFARRILSAERSRRMTAFMDGQLAAGRALAEVTEMELTALFGPRKGNPNDEVARRFLDEYRAARAARPTQTGEPASPAGRHHAQEDTNQ